MYYEYCYPFPYRHYNIIMRLSDYLININLRVNTVNEDGDCEINKTTNLTQVKKTNECKAQ